MTLLGLLVPAAGSDLLEDLLGDETGFVDYGASCCSDTNDVLGPLAGYEIDDLTGSILDARVLGRGKHAIVAALYEAEQVESLSKRGNSNTLDEIVLGLDVDAVTARIIGHTLV